MILKHIRAKNFYSFKELDLDLEKFKNIVYVKGINRDSGGSNGSGKSSILEMITFGLFGRTIRKSTEEAIVNCDSRKNLEVRIVVEKQGVGIATITRGKRPTMLNFTLGDVDLTQENALKTQDKIESTLGLSYKTFVASIVFGQHVDVEFLSSTTDDKRNIIRNFLNLEEVFIWRDRIKEFKSNYSARIKSCATLLEELFLQQVKLETKLIPFEAIELKETLQEVLDRESLLSTYHYSIIESKENFNDLQVLINNSRKTLAMGIYKIKDTCKSCKKVYIKKQNQADIDLINDEIQSDLNVQSKITDKINSLLNKIKKLSNKLTTKEWVAAKEKQDIFLSQKIIRAEYNDLLTRIKDKEFEKHKFELSYEVMRFWEKAFSEQGIIKYFIRNVLDYLNFKTNEYLSLLTNNQFIISFNDELEETITNNGRKLSYISLSGGEKKKINLSVMLSLQSLLSHTSKDQSNIIFFDEIAENMDADGCLGIHNLLTSLKEEDKTIFLITHNSHLKSLLDGCQILTVEKKDGESKVISHES